MLDLSNSVMEFPFVDTGILNPDTKDAESKIECYEELLYTSMIYRAAKKDPTISLQNQDKVFPYIKHILEWLRTTDFYVAPASTKYHDACHCGLLNHTLKVYNELVGLRKVPKFQRVVEDQWWSAAFTVLVHDWCKIGRYESYYKNVKNPSTGDWEQVLAYKYKEDGVARFGHGTQSLVMAMQLCNNKYTSLTFEEMAAIRWHMDNWDITRYEADDLSQCNNRIPMVRMIQFADQLAITEY